MFLIKCIDNVYTWLIIILKVYMNENLYIWLCVCDPIEYRLNYNTSESVTEIGDLPVLMV